MCYVFYFFILYILRHLSISISLYSTTFQREILDCLLHYIDLTALVPSYFTN